MMTIGNAKNMDIKYIQVSKLYAEVWFLKAIIFICRKKLQNPKLIYLYTFLI